MGMNYEDEYSEVGKRIVFYRQKRGISQEELSEMLNCSRQDIQQIEGDYCANRQPLTGIWLVKNLDFLFMIAEALKVDLPVFFLPMSDEVFEKYRTDQ